MPWDAPDTWDRPLLDEFKRLIALRRSSDALARGGIRYAHVSDDAIAFLRESPSERLLVLAARAPHEPIRLALDARELEPLLGGERVDGRRDRRASRRRPCLSRLENAVSELEVSRG